MAVLVLVEREGRRDMRERERERSFLTAPCTDLVLRRQVSARGVPPRLRRAAAATGTGSAKPRPPHLRKARPRSSIGFFSSSSSLASVASLSLLSLSPSFIIFSLLANTFAQQQLGRLLGAAGGDEACNGGAQCGRVGGGRAWYRHQQTEHVLSRRERQDLEHKESREEGTL